MTNKTIGYGRVSTTDQNLDDQHDTLTKYGVDELYVEKFTGTKASRPQWDLVKGKLRKGDTLVVTKLDRLGRSTRDLLEIAAYLEAEGVNLVTIKQPIDTTTAEGKLFFTMVAAFAEFEHAMMKARTLDGLAAARARGRVGGRKAKLTERQITDIRARVLTEKHSIKDVADDYKVSRPTIYRALEGA
jgi:DNA invertase Pin-like site-specific DNA recombinase